MKIGITADIHLTSNEKHPERSNAFVDILHQCNEQGIEELIISGDLFDAPLSNYSEFESICRSAEFSKIQLLVIPGNHDMTINRSQVVAKNLHIFEEPTREKLADGWEACFVPYSDCQTMGSTLVDLVDKGNGRKWALVGHGDWIDNLNAPNPYENEKVYMPLTRRELDLFKPDFVFLGHIHMPQQRGKVYYAGSPCPIAVNETGYRRFLVLDTETGKVDQLRTNSDLLYFDASLLVIPTNDEQLLLRRQIEECKESWGISECDFTRAKVRIEVVGFSNDRAAVFQTIEQGFEEFELLCTPDISQVGIANDFERNFVVEQFEKVLDELDYPIGEEGQPDRDNILLRAMELVYGRT